MPSWLTMPPNFPQFNHVSLFLIFPHLLLQSASCSHTWGKTPCPRSVFVVWKAGFQFFFVFAVWYYRQKWVFRFWHSFRRPSMRSFQSAKIITESIFTKKTFSIALAGRINEHHTESSPPNWKKEMQPTRAIFFSRNFLCKKPLFGLHFFSFWCWKWGGTAKTPSSSKSVWSFCK